MRMLPAVMLLVVGVAGAAPVAVCIDVTPGATVSLQRGGKTSSVEVSASLDATDVLVANGPGQVTLLYGANGTATLDFVAGQLAVPVGAVPGTAKPALKGAVGKALAAAFAAPLESLASPELPASAGPAPTLDGDPQLPGLPEMDELSRWRVVPGAKPRRFEKLDDEKYGKVIGLAAALTEAGAPPGARLAPARWLESKGLLYAALFEYRNALHARLAKGKISPAYRTLARHVAGLALSLGDRGTARALARALN